jgi:hypothetical protein
MAGAQEKANTNNEVAVVAGSPVQRMLQDGQQSEFGLEVSLQGINGVPISSGQDDSTGGSAILLAVILILMAGGWSRFCFAPANAEAAGEIKRSIDVNKHITFITITSSTATAATAVSKIRRASALYTPTSTPAGGARDVQVD